MKMKKGQKSRKVLFENRVSEMDILHRYFK